MFSNKRNIFFLAVVGITFLVSLYPLYQRHQIERNNKTVEIVYSYDDIESLYLATGVYRNEIMRKYKIAGATSIIIKEDTIRKLVAGGKITFVEGSDIINNNRIFQRSYNQIFSRLPRQYSIRPEYYYLVIDENEMFEFVKRNLQIKLGENRARDLGWNILELISPKEELLDIAIDINFDKVALVNELDLQIMPMFINNSKFTEEQISYKLSRLNDYQYNTVLFNDDSVLGYPQFLDITMLKLEDSKKMYASIEFQSPSGFQYVASKLAANAIKLHTIDMTKRNEQKYVHQAVRAVVERNCRILYIRPFIDDQSIDIHDYNLSFIKRVKGTLEQKGYTVAAIKSSPYQNLKPSWLNYVSYIAVFIIGCVFLLVFFHEVVAKPIIFGAVLYVGLISLFYLTKQLRFLNEILALGVAVFSPVLIYIYVDQLMMQLAKVSIVKKYLIILSLVFSGSLFASVVIRNLLYHSNYFLAIWRFRGVKIANFLPLLLLAIFFYIKPERIKYIYYVIKRYISQHLSIRFLLFVFILLMFLAVYILRTGNYGVLVFGNLEILFRDLLQELFLVRPRTKEILFGYPLLVMSIYFWRKSNLSDNIKRGMLVFSAIASISMINTFCHMHSPFLISLYRSVIGMLIGSTIGIILIMLYSLINRIYMQKTPNKNA